jgi:phage terminase large subunit-like protein
MPTNIHRRKVQPRSNTTNQAMVEMLLTGHWWTFLVPRGEPLEQPPEERLRDIWRRNREKILERFPDAWGARNFDVEPDRSVATWEKWIRSDLDRLAVSKGYYFDEHAGDRVVKFFERFLNHSKGRWADKPFRLSNWQKYDLVMPLFGWKRPDKTRRYRWGYVHIPKKNGKSTLASGVTLYLLVGDNEAGAEVYCGAGDRDQAGIVFDESVNMVKASPALSQRLLVIDSRKNIKDPLTSSKYHAMSSDAYTKEGLNGSGVVIDELHAHPTADLIDALRYCGAARMQPLMLVITTAGGEQTGPCFEEYTYAQKLLTGVKKDDLEYFTLVYEADAKKDKEDPDYWLKPSTWYAANPALGDTLNESDMAQDAMKAAATPRLVAKFKRYRLNLWGYEKSKWLSMEKWNAAKGFGNILPLDFAAQKDRPYVLPAALRGAPAYVGIDLASTTDLAAVVFDFPVWNEERESFNHVLIPYFYAPEGGLAERSKTDRVDYRLWADQGFIEITEGNVCDYDIIRSNIVDLSKQCDIRMIGFDPNNSTQLNTQLESDGFETVRYHPGAGSMSGPSKDFENTLIDGRFIHGGHPVLTWCASNVIIKTDFAKRIRPDKDKSSQKIDGIVAAILAHDSSNRPQEKPNNFDGELTVIGG